MADEEISRTMEAVSLSAEQEEPLASLATKLRDESGLSREEIVLCADEFLKRMNETLPEGKRIHENQYYLTAREICQHPDTMGNLQHPIFHMFTRSAQNLKEAGDILFNVIIQYKVESMDGVPQEVTNLFVKEHAVFKSNLDGLANLTPTIAVMAVLQEIITTKHSTETLVGEVQHLFRFQLDLCKLISSHRTWRTHRRSSSSYAASSTRTFAAPT
jgi:hypothetical protein